MAERPRPTWADAIAGAIAPALIMTLVGSLAFFLLQVFYQGDYPTRLRWIMGLFIMAAVLIGRISMQQGTDRAAAFSAPLAIVTFLAMQSFVDYRATPLAAIGWLVNLALIALVWWSAHKLTWDSTWVDDTDEVSGRGLVEVLRDGDQPPEQPGDAPVDVVDLDSLVTDARPRAAHSWRELITRERRPHAHGVWIIYFSLVALPLFGLGQWWIPATDLAARRSSFHLMCIYVASGLGLLLLTSFLGLRRYLRRRRLPMPAPMAGAWIGTGCLLIVTVLGAAAMLPRPAAENFIARLPRWTSPAEPREASRVAVGDEGTWGSGSRNASAPRDQPSRPAGPPERAGDDAADRRRKDRSPGAPDRPQQGAAPTGQAAAGRPTSPQRPGSMPDKQPPPGRESRADGPHGGSVEQAGDGRARPPGDWRSAEPDGNGRANRGAVRPPRTAPAATMSTSPSTGLPWAEIAKACFQLVLGLIGAWLLWHNRRRVLAALAEAWRALCQLCSAWLGRRARPGPAVAEDSAEPPPPAGRPFADFTDPFATGAAERTSAEVLVRYTFEALEAWARERGLSRHPDQTPHEWADQLARRASGLSREVTSLADLVACAAYAKGRLAPGSAAVLESLWQKMQARPGRQ